MFLGATAGGIAFMFVQFPSELSMMSSEAKKTIPYYDPADDYSIARHIWDNVQPYLECCGADGWTDWELADKLKPGRKVFYPNLHLKY